MAKERDTARAKGGNGGPSDPTDSGRANPPGSGRVNQTIAKLLVAVIGFVLIGWGLGAICRSVFTASDLRIVQDIAASRTSWQTTAAHVFSFFGSGYVIYPVTVICAAALYTRGRLAAAVTIAVGTFGATLIENADKLLVGRPRPPVHHLEHASRQDLSRRRCCAVHAVRGGLPRGSRRSLPQRCRRRHAARRDMSLVTSWVVGPPLGRAGKGSAQHEVHVRISDNRVWR